MILGHLAAAAKLVLPRRHLGQRVGAQPVHNVTHAQLPVAGRPETVLPSQKTNNWACISGPIRLEALLKALNFPADSKSVISLELKVSEESVIHKTGFINSQLVKLQVWMKLEASENSANISSDYWEI